MRREAGLLTHDPAEILVTVPTRGEIQWATVTRLQDIRDAAPGLPPVIFQAGHLSVATTRNRVVSTFLGGNWSVLVMVDDDVVPPVELLDITDHIPAWGVVAVPTLIHHPQFGLGPAVFVEEDTKVDSDGLVECVAVGTGCVAISRELLEAASPEPFRLEGEESDDAVFCRRARELGFRVGADLRLAADHHTRVSLAAVSGAS